MYLTYSPNILPLRQILQVHVEMARKRVRYTLTALALIVIVAVKLIFLINSNNAEEFVISDTKGNRYFREFNGYEFNCSNLKNFNLNVSLGAGSTKQVYFGYNSRSAVAIKIVTPLVQDVRNCVKKRKLERFFRDTADCFTFPNKKLMKEILLCQQLHHPGIVKLLGFCVRSENNEATSLDVHGAISVYEHGIRFQTKRGWSAVDVARLVKQLLEIIEYMDQSPIGSLRIGDVKPEQFIIVHGQIKLADLDDVTSSEPSCGETDQCDYGISCEDNMCVGYNVRYNMHYIYRKVIVLLFQLIVHDNPQMASAMNTLHQKLSNSKLTILDFKNELNVLLALLYQFGT